MTNKPKVKRESAVKLNMTFEEAMKKALSTSLKKSKDTIIKEKKEVKKKM